MFKKTLASLTCSLFAAAAYAGTPMAPPPEPQPEPIDANLISYSNLSLGYNYTSVDLLGLDVDGHGAGIGLEFSPIKHLYLAARGTWTDFDVAGIDFDYWTGNAGVGGYLPLTENIHLAVEVGASYANLSLADFDNLDTDDWGLYVTPHVRMKFGAFETHLGVTYNSNDLATSEYSAFVRLMYEVAPQVDLYVGGSAGFEDNAGFDNVYGAQAGIRFKF